MHLLTMIMRWLGAVCIILTCLLFSCRRDRLHSRPGTPSPPDLRHCTRIEIRCWPSVFEAIIVGPYAEELLTPQETQYLQSLGPLTVADPDAIQALGRAVALSTYRETLPKDVSIAIKPVYYVTGYRGTRQMTSFLVRGPSIEDENRNLFQHNMLPGFPGFGSVIRELRPFDQRMRCAEAIAGLGVVMEAHVARRQEAIDPTQWCDMILSRRAQDAFQCPSAGPGRCHYAMNPACEPNSPTDMVLLFETKAGWNQHGGPELFTFDNHDPKGGCVLLNDGTVKFIRTEEELHALRWK